MSGCCGQKESAGAGERKLLVIAGSPNVGKSVLFNCLTGAYAMVSNYPGTTVEVSRGRGKIEGGDWEVVDTPGMYSLLPATEEERVARSIILTEKPDVVLHVVDARNIERMLTLTIQFMEAGLPLILVLNIMDEAEKRGVAIDLDYLRETLGIPVVGTVSTSGCGIDELKHAIRACRGQAASDPVAYNEKIEVPVADITRRLAPRHGGAERALALLLLQDDSDASELVGKECAAEVAPVIQECRRRYAMPLSYVIAIQRQRLASEIAVAALQIPSARKRPFADQLSDVLVNPWTGVPVLLLVLYFGLYKFVGVLGAGVVVDYLEGTLFEQYINPFLQETIEPAVPWQAIRNLLVGDYGVITLGLRYAIAIILPLVTFFFIAFSVMEDTGYLPRLALLIDRVFKKIGLSGRGVIPIVLGLGCDTMATMVTRTLPTRRERIIGTILLALAVPCSAQLGVIMALLGERPLAFAIWAGVITSVFLFIGFLAARFLPGEQPHFFMELPPLRLPKLSNVCAKTYTRVVWYLKEIIPLFLLASVLIWLGKLTGGFAVAIDALKHPVRWIGLPPEAARIFLYGFFRRDYGAAGLYDIQHDPDIGLTGIQLTVATIALTLFLPCIAQFLINIKERGLKFGIGVSAFVLLFSFAVAFVVNFALHALKVPL